MPIDRFGTFGIAGGGLFFTITGLANPFFTLYAEELGISTLAIGMMVTLRAVLPIFIAMPSGQLIDMIGPMRMLKYGNCCLIASLLMTVFADGIPLLALSQLFLGASIIIMASSFQVLVSKGERSRRNEAIKKYSMWMSAGGMLGPLLGGLIASAFDAPAEGYRMAFVASSVAAGLFMVALFWIARFYHHPVRDATLPTPSSLLSVGGVLESYQHGIHLTKSRPVQFGLTATFIIMYIQALYMSFLPLFLRQYGFSTMEISIAISLKGFAGMMARFLLGWLMARYPLERILTTAGLVAAFCVVLTPIAAQSTASMALVVLVMGAAVGINLPVSIMIMVDAIGEGDRGKLMGLRLLINRFSQVLSPAMFGIIGHAFGLTAAFYSGGILLVATMWGFSAYSSRVLKLRTWGGRAKPE